MDLEYVGQVYHHLLRHRSVELKPLSRRTRPGEHEVASILRDASIDDMERLSDFLLPQGFKIVEFDDDTPGIASNSRVWVLTRVSDVSADTLISSEKVYTEMKIKDGEGSQSSGIWFLHIWLMYLSLVYTRSGRGVSQVSGYIDAIFSRDSLEEATLEHIAHIRKFALSSDDEGYHVIKILDAEKGKDVSRRVKFFLDLMTNSGLIQKLVDDDYQQTLLGACEFAENYNASLRLPVENVLNTLVNIVTPNANADTEKGE